MTWLVLNYFVLFVSVIILPPAYYISSDRAVVWHFMSNSAERTGWRRVRPTGCSCDETVTRDYKLIVVLECSDRPRGCYNKSMGIRPCFSSPSSWNAAAAVCAYYSLQKRHPRLMPPGTATRVEGKGASHYYNAAADTFNSFAHCKLIR